MLTRRKAFKIVHGLALWLLVGCQPGITPSPVPSPHPIFIQVTPALVSLQPLMKECILSQGTTGLVLAEFPARGLNTEQAGMGLRWGAATAPDAYAAQIGEEELVIAVSSQNNLSEISLSELQSIYTGALRVWPDSPTGAEIQPWVYPPGDDVQEIFNSTILQNKPPSAQFVSIAPDPRAMLDTLTTNPAAIGYIPRRWLNSNVKELQVQGIDPKNLRKPILVFSQAEPEGLERDWLLCLQENLVE